jgi:hypothetical protein
MHASNATHCGSAVQALLIDGAHALFFACKQVLHSASGPFGLSALQSVAAHSFEQFAGTHMQSMVATR